MALKYYYDLMSQPCRAVYMFLRLNKIRYEDKPLAVRKGEHRTEEYAKINPFKLVPALEDDGFCLTESIAMVEYIMNTRPVPEHWYPTSDPQKRAKVSEYLHWQHLNTRLHCATLFRNLLLIPRATGQPVNQAIVQRCREVEIPRVVGQLESYFLRHTPFLSSPVMTVADLFGVCELKQLDGVWEEGLYMGNPRLKAWVQRVQEETGPVFDEAHKVVYMVREAYKDMEIK
ncbi:glutathione S-transferase theta-1-like [Babylonia areolata]|uniref:glutathione S-transferase theta-1-like n=1 Tax=Babylonia areolata TaxID=304850 RepID=UPI003FD679ED